MTSRPAAPESETPLGQCSGPFSDAKDCQVHKGDLLAAASCGHNDRFKCVFGLPREDDGCLACALERTERQHSLAQTEIKGHMRVEDELRRDLAGEVAIVNRVWKALGIETYDAAKPFAIDEHVTLLKARIAELEKAIVGECEECGQTILTPLHPLPSVEKDAARYRWLRANHLQTGTDSWIRTGDDLEEAIDAALKSRA